MRKLAVPIYESAFQSMTLYGTTCGINEFAKIGPISGHRRLEKGLAIHGHPTARNGENMDFPSKTRRTETHVYLIKIPNK